MTTSTDDWTLLEQWRRGDNDAARDLVARYYTLIHRFFANKVAVAHEAVDLTQETFAACAGRKDMIRPPDPEAAGSAFRRYLFGIAANLLRGYIGKKLKRARELDDFAEVCVRDYVPSLHSIVTRRREELLLVVALRELPLDQQIAIELNMFEELSGSEIAAMLGVSEGTIRSRLRLAKARLAERIEQLAESPEERQSTLTDLQAWALAVRRRIDG
jgi:RNA polymerase sigma-70 factor (ECF subfamily)